VPIVPGLLTEPGAVVELPAGAVVGGDWVGVVWPGVVVVWAEAAWNASAKAAVRNKLVSFILKKNLKWVDKTGCQ